jgi:type III pantothenate kinase
MQVLCLDIGNTQIFGGLFIADKLQFTFRHDTTQSYTSDQLGIFLRDVLRANNSDPSKITHVSICSVVPHLDYSIGSACKKYFSIEPFILQPGVKTGIKIKYANPLEVGADRISEAIAAVHLYPGKNVVTIDFGTATAISLVNTNKEFLGGLIMPGIRLCMESLQNNTAKLPTVKIVKPSGILGASTIESIQAGLYYGQLAAIKEITKQFAIEVFAGEKPIIIGTGGFAHLFAEENVFTKIVPDMVLEGLLLALKMNT